MVWVDRLGAHVIAENLRRTRLGRGLTQAAVAEAAGITREGYRNLETGASEPRPRTLHALAEALGVSVGDLVTPVTPLRQVHFRSLKRLKTREEILADVGQRLADFAELEELLGARQEPRLNIRIPAARDRPVAAAAAVRQELDLSDQPIRDICGLLESMGIKVLRVSVASDAFFGLSVGQEHGGPAVVVNTWERIAVERWIFTAAHELGHLLLHRAAYDVERTTPDRDEEQAANRFAAHFLMPQNAFVAEWDETEGMALIDRVLKVKRIFKVSYKTVLYRIDEHVPRNQRGRVWPLFQRLWQQRHGHTLGKEDEPLAAVPGDFWSGYAEAWRSGEPARLLPNDFVESRLLRLIQQAVERHVITLSRAAEIQGLPLAEMQKIAASWGDRWIGAGS